MAYNDSINGLYGANGLSTADAYMLAALNSYNPNFRGAEQVAQATQTTAVPQISGVQQLPKADYSEGSDSSTGMVLGLGAAAVGAATLIYAAKKGKLDGIKKWFTGKGKSVAEEAVGKVSEKAASKLEGMKVVREGNKFVYYVPGKTEKLTKPNEIASRLKANPQLEAQLKSMRFSTGETQITKGTYTIDGNKIKFDGDKIVEIKNASGNKITSQFVENGKIKSSFASDADRDFATKIDDYLGYIRKGDTDIIRGKDTNLEDFTYITTIGDNVATVSRKHMGKFVGKGHAPAKIESLTTLKKCDANSTEVLAYTRKSRADGKNIDALTSKDFLNKRTLPDGYKVGEFMYQYDGKKFKVVNGEVKEIIVGNKHYKEGQDFFEAYMERDSKAKTTLKDRIEKELKGGNIPDGATIVPA